MKMWHLQACRLIFLSCIPYVLASVRQWKTKTSLDNLSNWNASIRCSNDRLVFPADVKAVVIVQQNYTLQELRLPNNGILIFGEGANMVFSSAPDRRRGCSRQGNELKFVAGTPKSWFDSANWCIGEDCEEDKLSATYVDAEVVPCMDTQVIFPEKSTFSVDVYSNVPIEVKSIELRGSFYNSTAAFNMYFNGDLGLTEFVTQEQPQARSRIAINSAGCLDPAGCVCENIHPFMEELICPHTRLCKTNLLCTHPVKAEGNCCPTCGSLINVTTGPSFAFSGLKAAVKEAVTASPSVQNIRWAITKISASELQVMTSPSTADTASQFADGSTAITVGCLIFEFLLQSEIQQQYGVSNVLAVNSDGTTCHETPSSSASTQIQSPRNVAIGVVVGVFIIIALSIMAFICRRSLSLKLQALIRGVTSLKVHFDGQKAEIVTFDNPMYDVPLPFSPDKSDKSIAFDARSEAVIGLENPLYPGSGSDLPFPGGRAASSFGGSTPSYVAQAAVLPTGHHDSRTPQAAVVSIGFDNPLCTVQNGSAGAACARQELKGSQTPAKAPQSKEKQSWSSRLRLPKLSAAAAPRAADERGFANPLYQSPSIEVVSFSPLREVEPSSRESASASSALNPASGGPGGAGVLLDDDFLLSPAAPAVTDDLIL